MSMNLMLAIYYEHKERTGHDIFKAGNLYNKQLCNVCMFIHAENKDLEKQEEIDYNKKLESASP